MTMNNSLKSEDYTMSQADIKNRLLDDLAGPRPAQWLFSKRLLVGNPLGVLRYNDEDFIASIYLNILKRKPEPKGFNNNLNLLWLGIPKEKILYACVVSTEAAGRPMITGQPAYLKYGLMMVLICRKLGRRLLGLWPRKS